MPGLKTSHWSYQDSTNLDSLLNRLSSLEPMSLWNEPLDIMNSGPEFFSETQKFIMEGVKILKDLKTDEEIHTHMVVLSKAISCLFGVSIQTGNYEIILRTLDTLNEFQDSFENLDQASKIY